MAAQANTPGGAEVLEGLNRRQLAHVLGLVMRSAPSWERVQGAQVAVPAVATRCYLAVQT
jgi:hypothetical protein